MSEEQVTSVAPTHRKYNTYRLHGKVAMITGGTMGIGLAVAERLGQEGCKLVVSSRRQTNVDKAVQTLIQLGIPVENVTGCVCHVGNATHRRALVDFTVGTFKRIDVLFHNAGVNPAMGHILEVSEPMFDKILDTNITSAFFLTKLAVPHMAPGSSIIFNSSVSAYFTTKGILTYGAVKSALITLTSSLSRELAHRGIRVNCIAPATTRTKMAGVLYREDHEKHDVVHKEKVQLLPRIAEPEEVAGGVAYLASDDASFVSGETHLISGGVDCRL
ncbi:Dehydrogenase/reductase SDR family member 4 [Aphelenchoides besseyi]|nr:Dehydrogenase/reductase SDR family member 4 [Aphelenchoides besseyi]